MRDTTFFTVSGGASSTRANPVLSAATHDRIVKLVLDDTNWFIELSTIKNPEQGGRGRMPMTGPFEIKLAAGQELFAFARLNPSGGAGTQWDLSVAVMDAP